MRNRIVRVLRSITHHNGALLCRRAGDSGLFAFLPTRLRDAHEAKQHGDIESVVVRGHRSHVAFPQSQFGPTRHIPVFVLIDWRTVVKNKVAPPFLQAEFDLIFGEGISKIGELLDVAVENGIVQKSGAWFSYNDARLGQGRNNAKDYLIQYPEIAAELEAKIRTHLGIHPPSAPASLPEVDAEEEVSEEATT